jgi:hypothetical protein
MWMDYESQHKVYFLREEGDSDDNGDGDDCNGDGDDDFDELYCLPFTVKPKPLYTYFKAYLKLLPTVHTGAKPKSSKPIVKPLFEYNRHLSVSRYLKLLGWGDDIHGSNLGKMAAFQGVASIIYGKHFLKNGIFVCEQISVA